MAAVNHVLPGVGVTAADIDFHYAGVRPLPATGGAAPAGITRRHWLQEHDDCPVPVYSVIGGKLTTCRSLAESAADTILGRLGLPRRGDTRNRYVPGGAAYPSDALNVRIEFDRIAARTGWPAEQVAAVWSLLGTRTAAVLAELAGGDRGDLDGTRLPVALARWCIRHEWARTLPDLVERRLMLLYHPRLTRQCLDQVASALVAEGFIAADRADEAVRQAVARLCEHYGKRVVEM
jgi:glycerol-3-phosphate dehydrogenase